MIRPQELGDHHTLAHSRRRYQPEAAILFRAQAGAVTPQRVQYTDRTGTDEFPTLSNAHRREDCLPLTVELISSLVALFPWDRPIRHSERRMVRWEHGCAAIGHVVVGRHLAHANAWGQAPARR